MAAPIVAGTAALMIQANPKLTPNLVKAIIEYTAQDYGYDALTQGAGFLNTKGAVDLARFYYTARYGQTVPTNKVWSRTILWGNHKLKKGVIKPQGSAYALNTTWGSALTAEGDNIVWGTNCKTALCDGVIWGTAAMEADNIVWGTFAKEGDNIVWGTALERRQHRLGHRAREPTTSCGAPRAAAPTATTSSGAPAWGPSSTTSSGARRRWRPTTSSGAPAA